MDFHPLSGLDLKLDPEPWPFAAANRGAIDRFWQDLVVQRPQLWNGTVLICRGATVQAGILSGRFAKTDYASFVAWRDWGIPDAGACNIFGTPALLTSDRAMIFAEMAPQTLNAGMIYPPSGSLEPRDIAADGTIDVLGSLVIELAEETGLDAGAARRGAITAIRDAHRIAVVQTVALPMTADAVQAVFASHRDPEGELARLVVIRSAQDVHPRMPGYAQEIVRRFDHWFEGH